MGVCPYICRETYLFHIRMIHIYTDKDDISQLSFGGDERFREQQSYGCVKSCVTWQVHKQRHYVKWLRQVSFDGTTYYVFHKEG